MPGSRHPEPRRPPRSIPTPRPGGGHRLLVELDPRTGRDYRRAVGPLVPRIERSLGPGVLANRAARGSELRLAPWRPAWARWLLGTRGPSRAVVVHADVSEFYASVRDTTLRRTLGDGATPVLEVLRALWDEGVMGLPIGPEPSAFVANAILGTVDEAVARMGLMPLRWVDDYLIRAPSGRRAGAVLLAIERGLHQMGLRLNPEKTVVLPSGVDDRRVVVSGSSRRASARAMMRAP